MKIADLFENKWDDFGRTEFPDEYFADIDQSHAWMDNAYTRYPSTERALSAFETGAFSRSPHDFTNDLFSFSAEQLSTILQVHGVPTAPGLSKFELIKLAVRNQARIGQAVTAALRKQTRPT